MAQPTPRNAASSSMPKSTTTTRKKQKKLIAAKQQPTASTASTAPPTSTTRLCVKNLPAHYTSTQLRSFITSLMNKHQSQRNNNNNKDSKNSVLLTDCRVLLDTQSGASRRLAFCGFATATQATAAVHTLHGAYCGTHKLLAEFAQGKHHGPRDDTARSSKQRATVPDNNNNKQLEPKHQEDRVQQEYLSLMGVGQSKDNTNNTTTNRKFWANDLAVTGLEPQTAAAVQGMPKEDSDSDRNGSSESSSDSSDGDESDNDKDTVDPVTNAMDFLRSKQVGAKDLAHDDDDSKQQLESKHDDDFSTSPSSSSSSSSDSNDDSSSSDDDDAETERKERIFGGVVSAAKTAAPGDATTTSRQAVSVDKADTETKEEVDGGNSNDENDDSIQQNRLFLRNLPFSATEDDIRSHLLQQHLNGNSKTSKTVITECHVAVDDQHNSKGFAFVTFADADTAQSCLAQYDGHEFMGRLLHILPARHAPSSNDTDNPTTAKNLSYKEQQEVKRKRDAATKHTGWLTSFVRGDAVVDNLATRLGLRKGDILNVKDSLSSGDAAVRLALGETAVIQENRTYFSQHGIDMEALVSLGSSTTTDATTTTVRSKTAILVKNLPHDTAQDELRTLFQGDCTILLPPSRTIAVVRYGHANDAKLAFRRLAYRRFKSVPLYLEWAPLSSMTTTTNAASSQTLSPPQREKIEEEGKGKETSNAAGEPETEEIGPTATLYMKNLNFSTTEKELQEFIETFVNDVRTVRIPTKIAPLKRGRETEQVVQSMGYGFVEFGKKESARMVLKKCQGALLNGSALEIKPSNTKVSRTSSATTKTGEKSPSKLMVRNVPFQANRKELLQLFGSFGQLKKVRLPKKFDGSHRGFAFVEFLTAKDAANAMQTLSRTHLYGRHLVLEWAAKDEEVEDLTILREKAERDMTPKGKKTRFNY